MYESHFQLSRRPFSATPDTQSIVDIDTFLAAKTELTRCIELGLGIGVLTASAGMGKTLLCEKLREQFAEIRRIVLLANAKYADASSFLKALLYELSQPYVNLTEQELRLQLDATLRGSEGRQSGLLLIVDEAEQLGTEVLHEFRGMTNLAQDGEPLVQIILSGLPQLEETLAHPMLQGLNQRVGCQVTLEPLSIQDSVRFVEERLLQAGGQPAKLLSPEAIHLICRASDGSPRCLNQLCDHCLVLTYVEDMSSIDAEIVHAALEDLKQLPLTWNDIFDDSVFQYDHNDEPDVESSAIVEEAVEAAPLPAVEIGSDCGSAGSESADSKIPESECAQNEAESRPIELDRPVHHESVASESVDRDTISGEIAAIEVGHEVSKEVALSDVQNDQSADQPAEIKAEQNSREFSETWSVEKNRTEPLEETASKVNAPVEDHTESEGPPFVTEDIRNKTSDDEEMNPPYSSPAFDAETMASQATVSPDVTEEEIIFDRYAIIDSGRTLTADILENIDRTEANLPINLECRNGGDCGAEQTLDEAAEVIKAVNESAHLEHGVPQEPREFCGEISSEPNSDTDEERPEPAEIIDRLIPMIDNVLDKRHANLSDEEFRKSLTILKSENALDDRKAEDVPSGDQLPSSIEPSDSIKPPDQSNSEPENHAEFLPDTDIEGQIGASVLEVCLETQQATQSTSDNHDRDLHSLDSTTGPADLNRAEENLTVDDSTETPCESATAGSIEDAQERQREFSRLFSVLRKQRLAKGA